MLAFNVAQLLKEGIGAFRHRPLEGELYDIDEQNPGPVTVEGEVDLVVTPDGILAEGQAEMTLTQVCRRCLELVKTQITVDIEEEYVPKIDVVTGVPLPATEDDEPELLIDEHHTLDLTEVLRQYAIEQNLRPGLCRENCKGLCPTCGINRNVETCECETTQIDPRLAALAQLLESDEEE